MALVGLFAVLLSPITGKFLPRTDPRRIATAGFFIPLVSITLPGLPGHRIPAASGLSNFVRIMCGGIGTSIFSTAWEHRSIVHHVQLVEGANSFNLTFNNSLQQMQSLGMSQAQSIGLFNSMATQQAAQLGVNDTFYFYISAGFSSR